MKHKVCISVDEATLVAIKAIVRTGKFRNKSQAFEFAANKLVKEDSQ